MDWSCTGGLTWKAPLRGESWKCVPPKWPHNYISAVEWPTKCAPYKALDLAAFRNRRIEANLHRWYADWLKLDSSRNLKYVSVESVNILFCVRILSSIFLVSTWVRPGLVCHQITCRRKFISYGWTIGTSCNPITGIAIEFLPVPLPWKAVDENGEASWE